MTGKTGLRLCMVALLAMAATACGSGPSGAGASARSSDPSADARLASLAEESLLRDDLACAAAPARYTPAVDEALRRHHVADPDARPAGHPVAPAGGIDVRVCDDAAPEAFGYRSTITLSGALLTLLDAGARAATLDPDGSSGLVAAAAAGVLSPDDLMRSAASDRLFGSEVAFVLYHELGHVLLGHLDRTGEPEPLLEREADAYAARVHAAARYDGDGIDLLFTLLGSRTPAGDAAHGSPASRRDRLALD